jgi:hypothetical protein
VPVRWAGSIGSPFGVSFAKRVFLPAVLGVALLVPVAPPAEAASFVARLKASGHHPKAGKRWPIRVSARTRSGRPLRARAHYEFYYGGRKVSTQYPNPGARPGRCPGARGCRERPYAFRGSFRDRSIVWPRRAVGIRLTFRVVVRVRGRGTRKLDYWVRVRR